MVEHVHMLISPIKNPSVTHYELVPIMHQQFIADYYRELGWDVLVITDAELYGDLYAKPA